MDSSDCYIRIIAPAQSFLVTISFIGKRLALMGSYSSYSGRQSGQIADELRRIIQENPENLTFSKEVAETLCDIWDRWHLNDMKSGTPRQERALRELTKTSHDIISYGYACKYLKKIGLYNDNGYRYGSKWLSEEVPLNVLKWLFSLPGEGSSFDDIYSPEIDEQSFISALCV